MMQFTKYERARIIGARALQVSMGAPILVPLTPQQMEAMHYSPIDIAKKEFDDNVLPLTIKRPLPVKL